jgi:hypothetical protein
LQIKPQASEISAPSERFTETDERRRFSPGLAVLVAMGGLGILVAAYAILVWVPNRNRLLLQYANDKYVLGHEPKASEVGGLVMRAGGTVRYLTASEFNAMPKIKTRAEK